MFKLYTTSCLLVLFAFTQLAFSITSQDLGFAGRAKAKKFQIMAKDNSGVVPLSVKSFEELVLGQGRTYFTVVLFLPNVTHEKCHLCRETLEGFNRVAEIFRNGGCEATGLNSLGHGMRPVFFGIIQLTEETKLIFKQFSVGLMAQIMVIGKESLEFKSQKWRLNRHNIWEIVPSSTFDLQKLITFINERTGREVRYSENLEDSLQKIILIVPVLILLGLVLYLLYDLILSPVVWFIVTLSVYFVCISGLVFVKYNKFSWIGWADGGNEYICRDASMQYEIEGYLMSGLMCSGGLGLVILNSLRHLPLHKRWVSWVVRFISGALVYYIYFVCTWTDELYRIKWSYYFPTFEPPQGYIQGPLHVDQGTSL